MTEEDLRTIESELEITLPPMYREAALQNTFSEQILHNPSEIIFVNRGHRSGEFGDTDWPNTRFCFGSDAIGDSLCIDLSKPNFPVLLRDHETSEILPERESFAAWLDLYQKTGETCRDEFEDVVPRAFETPASKPSAVRQLVLLILGLCFVATAVWTTFDLRIRRPGRAIHCQSKLLSIDGAKAQWAYDHKMPEGTEVKASDIVSPDKEGYLKRLPSCPYGGEYELNPVGIAPVCKSGMPGHSLSEIFGIQKQ